MTSTKDSIVPSFSLQKEDEDHLKNHANQIQASMELVEEQKDSLRLQLQIIHASMKADDKMDFAALMVRLFQHIHNENKILKKIQEIDEKRNKLEEITIEKYISAGLEHIRSEVEQIDEEIENDEEEKEEEKEEQKEEQKDEPKKEEKKEDKNKLFVDVELKEQKKQ